MKERLIFWLVLALLSGFVVITRLVEEGPRPTDWVILGFFIGWWWHWVDQHVD